MSILRGKRFIVRYGQGGHEHEHCVNIEGYSGVIGRGVNIPEDVAEALSKIIVLPVMNRGSRIEIVCDESRGPEIEAALTLMGGVNDPEGAFLGTNDDEDEIERAYRYAKSLEFNEDGRDESRQVILANALEESRRSASYIALHVSDALRFTEQITETQRVALADALRDFAVGRLDHSGVFKRMLDAKFQTTAPFDPEKWKGFLDTGEKDD